MLQAVIFDFDGVIVDSERLHYEAFVALSRDFGVDFDYDTYVRRYIGFDDREAFTAMLGEAPAQQVAHADVAELGRRKHLMFRRMAEQRIEVFPGVRPLIDGLAGHVPLAIASGATKADLDLCLGKIGLAERFEIVVSADDVSRSKPDPTTYALAVQRLSASRPGPELEPGRCLAIEDTDAGIRSAGAAGLRTLGVGHTGPLEDLRRAERVVASLEGLSAQTLQQWFS
jgi:beta-phosphoglucomutase